jgi:hypothetical protein
MTTRVLIEDSGKRGLPGPKGDPGTSTGGGGVPAGGTTSQALVKLSNTDYDVGWGAGGGGGNVAADTHAATSKTTPIDADELPLVDSAASFGLKKLTIANLKNLMSAFLSSNTQTLTNKDLSSATNTMPAIVAPVTHAATSKTTPVDADEIPLADSAASFAIKKLTVANLKSLLSTYLSSNTQTLTNKDLTSGTNTFPALTNAAYALKTTTVNGQALSSNVSIGFPEIAVGEIEDDQQFRGAVVSAFYNGSAWVDASGTTLSARPSSRSNVTIMWIDQTPTGAAPIPSWAIAGHDLFLQATGTGPSAPSPLVIWYGTGISNGTSLAATSAGTGDSPAVTSVGGTTAPTINTGAAYTPAVSFAQAAAQVCNLHYTVGSTQAQGRARFFFQTPSAWYSSSQTIFRFTDSSDALLAGITLRGSSLNGALSINDTTSGNIYTEPSATLAVSTWYRVEFVIDQTGGLARLYVYNTTGGVVHDSGNQTMSVGAAGWSRCVWGPTVSSVTTSMLMAKLKILADPAVPVGTA